MMRQPHLLQRTTYSYPDSYMGSKPWENSFIGSTEKGGNFQKVGIFKRWGKLKKYRTKPSTVWRNFTI